MADAAGNGSEEEAADWSGLGARPKVMSRKEKKKEKKLRQWQYGSGEGSSGGEEEEGKTEEGKEGKKVKKVKMEVVGGSGQEVATVTRSSRARWAVGYGSEEDAWLVGNMARNMVRTEQRDAEFRRSVDGRRLDVVDRLALLNIEGNKFSVELSRWLS